MTDAKRSFACGFVLPARRFGNHLLLSRGERPHLVHVVCDSRRIAARCYKRSERLHQVPCWTVGHCLKAGVHVLFWTASPAFAAGDQLEFYHALGAEIDCDLAIRILRGRRHEESRALFQSSKNIRATHNLRKMRGANLLLAFAHENEIHRRLAAGSLDRMQCSEKRCLWSLLVHCTASNNNFPKSGLVDQSSFKWRGRPLRRINLLHVVHKIKTNRLGRAIVHHCEDTRLSFGWDLRDLRKARLAQHVHHQPAAFLHPTILGGNRRLANPGL